MGLIWIVGFTCSGKSSIAAKLAQRMNKSYIDTDQYIESLELCSVADIFNRFGEKKFRELEIYVIDQIISNTETAVVSAGGGVYANDDLRKKLDSSGMVIHLDVDFETIMKRLQGAELLLRPKFTGLTQGDIYEIYKKRFELYLMAEIQINCLDRNIDQIVELILMSI